VQVEAEEGAATVIPRNDDLTSLSTQPADGGSPVSYTFEGRAGDFVQIELDNVERDGFDTSALPPATVEFKLNGRAVAGSKLTRDEKLGRVTLTVERLRTSGVYTIEYTGQAGFQYFMDFTSYVACDANKGIRNNPSCAAGRVCFNFDGWLRCTTPARPGDNCAESLSCTEGYYCKGDMGDDDGVCTKCRPTTRDSACR
jgi:hypothetical protein